MLLDQAMSILNELFEPAPEGHPLLTALRSDLEAAFPELKAQQLIDRARADLMARGDPRLSTEGPVVRFRAQGAENAVGSQSARPPHPAVETACIPADTRSEGWFVSHVFRIAKVHEEVRRLGVALDRRSDDPMPCLAYAISRVRKRPDNSQRIHDHLQQTFTRVLEKAWQYECGEPFCPWFLKILSTTIANAGRLESRQPSIDPKGNPDEASVGPSIDNPTAELGLWLENVIDGFIDHNVEVPPEWFARAAELELKRIGINYPSDKVIIRRARYLRRLFNERIGRGEPGGFADEVPLNLYELYVALGTHHDLRKELDAGDWALAELVEVELGIEALIVFQEAKDRGEAVWHALPDGAIGPIEQLARVQAKGWGLLAGRTDTEVVWKAARNLHWFSWRMKAAATLAVGLRYAERGDEPSLQPIAEALRRLDCIRTFPRNVQEGLRPLLKMISDVPVDGVVALLRAALCRACSKASDRFAVGIDAELPEADWRWWISRVTGRDEEGADAAALRLPGRGGLGCDTLDRS